MWELILRVLASRGSVYSTGSRKTCSLTNNEQKTIIIELKAMINIRETKNARTPSPTQIGGSAQRSSGACHAHRRPLHRAGRR